MMNFKMVLVFTLSLLITGVYSQQQITYSTETAIPYYSNDKVKGDYNMQKMCVIDMYYPTNIKNFPTIVWFHGGGLTVGK